MAGPEARLYHMVLHEVPPNGDVPWDITQETKGYHIEATIAFTHADGDLDLYLWYGLDDRPDWNNNVAWSESGDDNETVTYTVPAGSGGTYRLLALGWFGETNTYSLTTTITP